MPRKMPPLNALRAFEASARHLSFTLAAEELCVTQSAVSRQVRNLEDYLQVPLFERGPRTLILTDQGQAYLPSLRNALDIIHSATSRLIGPDQDDRLLIRTSLPTLTMRWLIPRLLSFQAIHPELQVELTTSMNVSSGDFFEEDVDIILTRGTVNDKDVRNEQLMPEVLLAVCNPRLLEPGSNLLDFSDLERFTLLYSKSRPDMWDIWLRRSGHSGLDTTKSQRFEHLYMAIQAAVAGLGILVAPLPTVEDELASGHLILPFNEVVSSDEIYFLASPEGSTRNLKVRSFRNWIIGEAEKSQRFLKTSCQPDPVERPSICSED